MTTEADLLTAGFTPPAVEVLRAYRQRADRGNVDEWLDEQTIQRLTFVRWMRERGAYDEWSEG